MSNFPPYSLIDDDHIDDQETINVGNLIIDLESDLEKEKIENEQAHAKPTNCTNTTGAPTSSTSSSSPSATSFAAKASSSTSASSGATSSSSSSSSGSGSSTTTNLNSLTLSGKSNQKSSGKQSIISTSNNANIINNNNNNSNNIIISNANNNNNINSISTINSSITTANTSNNNGHLMTKRTVFKSLADESRGELKMIITRETKPGKSEHKIITSPNQKSPTSSSSSTNINETNATSHSNNYEDSQLNNESISKPLQSSSSISSTKECGTSTSIGTITEPDCLGPCEPGTSVTLEGIVWQETDGGILVVNVTWRGKTYVGALLDCTRHDWAPPRLCDSPASDIDSKAHKGVRTKRIVTRSNGVGLDEKNLLQTTGKLRNGKGRRILTSNDLTPCNKRQRDPEKSSIENMTAQSDANTLLTNVSTITNSETACVPMNIDTTPATNNESISTSNILTDKAGPNSPIMIGCSEPNCSKKFRNNNGLMYHKTHAHGADNNESNYAQDNDCSSSVKDKVDTKVKGDQVEPKQDAPSKESDPPSPRPNIEATKQIEDPVFPVLQRRRTPSPQLTVKMSNKSLSDSSPMNSVVHNPEPPRPTLMRSLDSERRHSLDTNHSISHTDFNRRSPGTSRHVTEHGHGFNNHSGLKPPPSGINIGGNGGGSSGGSSNSKQINPPPLPVPAEEGMKPSGTSTGPPPAPHQNNCYFNSAFLANTLNLYNAPPYFPRPPLPMYDPLAPPTSSTNAAFLSRFMPNLRIPPPLDSASRLLTPPMSKNPMLPPTPLPPFPPPNAYPPFPPPASHPPPFPPPTK